MRNRLAGSSLLEVLISLVVFSVALIGIAFMLLTSMRNQDATLQRSHSTLLAQELYEKMLANMPAVEAGDYDLAMGSAIPTAAASCSGVGANCSTAQLAGWDLVQWGARVQRSMAGADAAVIVADKTIDPLVIEIQLKFKPLLELAGETTEVFFFSAKKDD